MASPAEHQKSIWENTRRIVGDNPASDFECSWHVTVEGQIGGAALTLHSVEPPAYLARFVSGADVDGMMLLEEYTFGIGGYMASVARINTSVNGIFGESVQGELQAQREGPISLPGVQDYARLAEILSQGPTAGTPDAGQ